ncbi:multi-sensor signal transduction histidine kinase [Gloeocapsa sp. PCC 7428]|uniref:CHASE domain-containing sensor histidine kinase n=1 Tax=Gloeocapsa sp. PCC 7428 TaxID=1173026 RepID=UPI0002A5FB34|nr:CHASE domain-containing protein [Gloeocapsa sp. PCC 7428]AFZ30927.1 multi-sensor signal transduction histidine kinase [Gloeocapsa sp. PCC 7428]
MEPYLSSKLRQLRRPWIPYFVLVVTLLLTGIATYYVALTARTKDQLRFNNAVERTKDDIQNRLDTYISLLRSGSGLFAASDFVTRADFQAYVKQLELRDRYPGIQGIGFSVKVTSAQKDALIAELRQQGIQLTIRPEDKRSEYHSIIYLEPLDRRNQAAIGFDMFTEKVRRAAMERARDTGSAAASGKVTLVQEIDRYKQAGFLIYFPVYKNNSNPKTVAQRQAALLGFIYSPFRVDDLLDDIVSEKQYSYVNFAAYDDTNITQGNLLHRSHQDNDNYQPSLTTTTTIDIAGRTWSLVFTTRPEFVRASQAGLVPYVFFGGVAISLVLFGLTRSQARAKTVAQSAVAQMHESQAALRTSESRFRCLIEADIIGIITADLEGKILEANDAFLRMVGYEHEDLKAGLRWDDLTPAEHQHLDQLASQEIRTSGACRLFEKEYIRKDGQRIPVLLGGAIIEGSQDTCIAFVLDLTERKQLEVALRRQAEELAEANRLKDDFLAIVSHELRTPLNAMLGWVQLLRSRQLDEAKKAKALEVIERNAKIQTQLVEDLLDTSRLMRGQLHLQMRSVDILGVIEAAINTVQPTAAAKKIQIKTTTSEGIRLVWGDSDRLQQIVWNLLSNAVKFTPEGGEVEVKLNCIDRYVEIQVSDTGIGISPEFLPYVFDRFRQAESATTRSSSGLGLGLAIVRQLVELHGGTVDAKSAGFGHGATFIVKLPLWNRFQNVVTEDLISRHQTRSPKRIIR